MRRGTDRTNLNLEKQKSSLYKKSTMPRGLTIRQNRQDNQDASFSDEEEGPLHDDGRDRALTVLDNELELNHDKNA